MEDRHDRGLNAHIDAHWEAYARAESEGRFEPLEPFFSDDLVYLAHGIPAIFGKDAFRDGLNENMADAPSIGYRIAFERRGTTWSGDLAVDWGYATDSYTRDGETKSNRYAYQAIFRREPVGWRMIQMASFPSPE